MIVTVIATGYDLKAKDAGIEDLTTEIFKDYHTREQVHITKGGLTDKPVRENPQVEAINRSFDNLAYQPKPEMNKPKETSSTSSLPDWLKKKYKK